MTHDRSIRVAVAGGARTPFARAGTVFRKHSALDLGVHAVDGLLAKQSLDPQSVGELAFGITVVDARIPHLAKDIVFSSDLPSGVQALTLTNNCITGTSAITSIADSIVAGRAEIGIAGGGRVHVQPGAAVRQTGESHLSSTPQRPRHSGSVSASWHDCALGTSSLTLPASRSRPPACRWASTPSSWSRSGRSRVRSRTRSRIGVT